VTKRQWWRDAVVYEIYVRSFADSDGNGIGDLDGIRSRLPYLVDLGVDALWLTPFYPSPMADHGYDVADPTGVDPIFGDLAAFDRLLAAAHDAGLRLIVDVVPNHLSSAHPWFVEALADPSSPMRERFVFREGRGDGPPNNWRSVFGGPAWSRDDASGQWYLHLFDAAQPDLDWHCPAVHEEFERILRCWLDRGVDGFRIDVAHGLYKRPDLSDDPSIGEDGGMLSVASSHSWDRDEVLAVYEDWRRITDSYDGDRMLVGEVFLFDVPRIAAYVGDTRLHQAFNFTVMKTPWDAAALRQLEHFHPGTWVLSNHDLVRHVTRYGGGELGRRRGLAVTALLLALPGSPYLYQGEELGLEEADVPPEARQDPIWRRTGGARAGRDGCRTPIPWTPEPPGFGFTTGRPWLPFGADSAARAAAVQVDDLTSTYAAYRRLLAHRRALLAELGDEIEWLDAPPDVLAFRRGRLVAVLNTAGEPVQVEVAGARTLLAATAEDAEVGGEVVTVPASSTVWLLG
jgi:alpha-glucosidase